MVAESSTTTGSESPAHDLNKLLKTLLKGGTMTTGIDAGTLALAQGRNNQDGFGLNGILGIAALRMLGGFGNENLPKPLDANDVQNIVNASQAAATANSNATLLLKDIQDSSQEVISAVNAGATASQLATLNAEIANLQGQGHITTAIADSKYTATNEIHEAADNVIASQTANTAQLAATLNTLAMGLQAGHAEINASVAQAKYDNTIAVMNDGDKTRAAIALLASQIPNSRELDLQRQLTVALDDHRHTQTRGMIDSGNVSVVTNVNQNQAQAQLQAQVQGLVGVVNGLANHQQAMATAITIGNGNRGGNQTPTNVNQ